MKPQVLNAPGGDVRATIHTAFPAAEQSASEPGKAAPQSSNLNSPRAGIANGPWFKMGVAELDVLRRACDQIKYLSDCLAVFVTLRELANENRSVSFTTTRRRIAELSGVSLRQLDRVSRLLVACRILDVRQNHMAGTKELGPSTYTLRPIGTTSRLVGTTLRQRETHESGAVVQDLSELYKTEEEPNLVVGTRSEELPEALSDDLFRTAWAEWEGHLRENGKALTPTSLKKQLEELAGWGTARAVTAIRHSIAKGWRSIYEPSRQAATTIDRPRLLPDHTNGF